VFRKEVTMEVLMQNSGNMMSDCSSGKGSSEQFARLKFWETDDLFSCPIAGICLTVPEQKQLIKKAGIPLKNATLFEMHEILVASAKNENSLSRKIDSLLVRKFSRKSKSLLSMGEEELKTLWRSSFDAGDYVVIFWYLASCRNLSRKFRREIFGDIHMSMHRDSKERAQMVGQMALIKEERVKMAESVSEESAKRKALQKEFMALQREFKALKAHLATLEKERAVTQTALEKIKEHKTDSRLEELKLENCKLTVENGELAEKLAAFVRQAKSFEAEKRRLSEELSHKGESEALFQKEIREIMALLCKMKSCDKSCPSFDLCKKRVLIVGGITKMESLYRQIVESSGGIFEYHDGHVKGGLNRLECSFRRADIVLCPVNCNSHAACILVKQLGKKHNKPVQMLSGSGLSAISQGIRIPDVSSCGSWHSSPVRGIKSI